MTDGTYMGPLNRVGGVGSVGGWVAWVKFWRGFIKFWREQRGWRGLAWVEILAWVDGWRGYLFCLTCKNNKKNYERAESEEAKKNIKNNIQ